MPPPADINLPPLVSISPELRATQPLPSVMAEPIAELRAWAAQRTGAAN